MNSHSLLPSPPHGQLADQAGSARPVRRGARAATWAALSCAVAASSAAVIALGENHADAQRWQGHPSLESGQASVDKLDPHVKVAIRRAAVASEADSIALELNSGWRSRAHQQRLLDEAIERYGSREQALQWVATPDTSRHVHGVAVDVGPPEAAVWLASTNGAFGLCRTLANEPWHFEWTGTDGDGCPAPAAHAAAP